MAAGLLAPLFWACLQYLVYGDHTKSVWPQIAYTLWGTSEHLTLSVFLTACTSIGLLVAAIHSDTWQTRANNRQDAVNALERQLEERSTVLDQLNTDLIHKMKQFHQTNAHLQQSLDRREIMRLAADSLKYILGYDRVNVLLRTETGDALEFIASRGSGDDDVAGNTLPFDARAGVLYLAMQNRNEPLLVEDIRKMPTDYILRPPWDSVHQLRSRSFIICPISVNGVAVGLFGVDNKQKKTALGENDLDTVRIFAEQVSAALSKIELLQAVELLTGEIQRTFSHSLQHQEHFGKLVSEVRSDTRATATTVGNISTSAESLYRAVDDTGSATTEISIAVHQVSDNLARLNELMSLAIAATEEISAASGEVAEHAFHSHKMAETVQQDAQDGVVNLTQTNLWLQNIDCSIEGTTQAFRALTEKTDNIAHFLTLIKEINQKTKLLSLNASIIAAQAGEHGRPFAVVAEEIQGMYDETSQSALAIETLVSDVRHLTGAATDQLDQTRSLVTDGASIGRKIMLSLQKISKSASNALDIAANISNAIREQSLNAKHSAASIREMGEIVGMVSLASNEQASAINRIVKEVEGIESMAGSMTQATSQQEESIGHIDTMMDQVQIMAQQIFTEIGHRQKESSAIIEQLNQLKGDQNEVSAGIAPATLKQNTTMPNHQKTDNPHLRAVPVDKNIRQLKTRS
jgi:methyl-accepting chemotaxis protein